MQPCYSLMCLSATRFSSQIRQIMLTEDPCLHVDVMDGVWVPNVGPSMDLVASLQAAFEFKTQYHMLVSKPEVVGRILHVRPGDEVIVHIETEAQIWPQLGQQIEAWAAVGVSCSLAVKSDTPIGTLFSRVNKLQIATGIDWQPHALLLLQVTPGRFGQSRAADSLTRLSSVRSALGANYPQARLGIDGNVDHHLLELAAPLLDYFVAGTSLIDFSKNIGSQLRNLGEMYEFKDA